jgi:hypothetical protein
MHGKRCVPRKHTGIAGIPPLPLPCHPPLTSPHLTFRPQAVGCDYSPTLMTMTQFALVAAVSLPSQLRNNFKREIPFFLHALTVALFFGSSVLANLAYTPPHAPSHWHIPPHTGITALTPRRYSFHISIPVHQMFRAGNLPATLLLNMLVFKKRLPPPALPVVSV